MKTNKEPYDLLRAQIFDAVANASESYTERYIGFLTPEQQSEAISICKSVKTVEVLFFGGYEDAERVMLGIFPLGYTVEEYTESFPVSALEFIYRESDLLRHSDFLGALMALGIKREVLGDILIEQGRAVIFIRQGMSGFIQQNVSKIGKIGVTIRECSHNELPKKEEPTESMITVSSMRLDNIVSALCGESRGRAQELLSQGLVFVNNQIQQKNTREIKIGDKITIRRHGKFLIDRASGTTKKGRIKVIVKGY